ncbi:N-acetyltransferase family protein [Iodidimonas sp. SYSU 1G8]|uniref:GNAT family N-acetyltransferase n=1 Tax=Iodidimonas sp. SYSU 1G8 TaxID=3133967 RepID=UPI0031FE6476
MPDPVSIEDAAPSDVPAIAAILNHAILHTTAVWYDDIRTPAEMEAWFELKRMRGYPVLVARKDGQVLGYASYGPFRAFSGYRHTMELSVYVAAEARRSGAGRRLLAALIERARANGVHVLVGGIDADNEASIGLHAALGFQEVARMPQIGRKFDRWLTLVFMQKLLNEP